MGHVGHMIGHDGAYDMRQAIIDQQWRVITLITFESAINVKMLIRFMLS